MKIEPFHIITIAFMLLWLEKFYYSKKLEKLINDFLNGEDL